MSGQKCMCCSKLTPHSSLRLRTNGDMCTLCSGEKCSNTWCSNSVINSENIVEDLYVVYKDQNSSDRVCLRCKYSHIGSMWNDVSTNINCVFDSSFMETDEMSKEKIVDMAINSLVSDTYDTKIDILNISNQLKIQQETIDKLMKIIEKNHLTSE